MKGVREIHSLGIPSESLGDVSGLFGFYAGQAQGMKQSLVHGFALEIVTGGR